MNYDFLIIGAGIVGAALASELIKRRPNSKIIVVEKEPAAAWHQTGRNSGVVHSGVYYTPGSLKSEYCHEGMAALKRFCGQRNISYFQVGKLLVATNDAEEINLGNLELRARQNNVVAQSLDKRELSKIEPQISGNSALLIPATAITDYTAITKEFLADVENAGGIVKFNSLVSDVTKNTNGYQVNLSGNTIYADRIIACAGLASDRVANMLGIKIDIRILPFKGEYFVLPNSLNDVTKNLIYPVPNPELPFLGVHLTPMVDGSITVGPNAVLSFAREKYNKFSFDLRDAIDAVTYPGLWRLLLKYSGATFNEMKGSIFKSSYLKLVQKYCPRISLSDLATYRSANRAQAIDVAGNLVDDFLIEQYDGVTAVLNAPSPAATGAMPIAKKIADDLL